MKIGFSILYPDSLFLGALQSLRINYQLGKTEVDKCKIESQQSFLNSNKDVSLKLSLKILLRYISA